MYNISMTIYALSSGPGISGIAVIRISGKETSNILKKMTGKEVPKPRVATLRKINKINTSELIDEGLILWFPGPESYTGEDMAETFSFLMIENSKLKTILQSDDILKKKVNFIKNNILSIDQDFKFII